MNAISSVIYETYKNGTVEDLINVMEATYSRYCDPIVLAMEADEATNSKKFNLKEAASNLSTKAQVKGYFVGQSIQKGVKTIMAVAYSMYRKIKDFIVETLRKLTRARGVHIYKSRTSYLENMCDIARDYIETISDNSLLDRARGEFAKKLDDYRNEFKTAAENLEAPITDKDKESGVPKVEGAIAMTRSMLQALDSACSSALVMAKKMEAAAVGDEDGIKKANFVKTYASIGANMANRCIVAINKIIRTTENDVKNAEKAIKNSEAYKANETQEKQVDRDARKSQRFLDRQQKKEDAKKKRAQARANASKKPAEATT